LLDDEAGNVPTQIDHTKRHFVGWLDKEMISKLTVMYFVTYHLMMNQSKIYNKC